VLGTGPKPANDAPQQCKIRWGDVRNQDAGSPVIALILSPTALHAQEKRIALLIGNKDYKPGRDTDLPLNDFPTVNDALPMLSEVLRHAQHPVLRCGFLGATWVSASNGVPAQRR